MEKNATTRERKKKLTRGVRARDSGRDGLDAEAARGDLGDKVTQHRGVFEKGGKKTEHQRHRKTERGFVVKREEKSLRRKKNENDSIDTPPFSFCAPLCLFSLFSLLCSLSTSSLRFFIHFFLSFFFFLLVLEIEKKT